MKLILKSKQYKKRTLQLLATVFFFSLFFTQNVFADSIIGYSVYNSDWIGLPITATTTNTATAVTGLSGGWYSVMKDFTIESDTKHLHQGTCYYCGHSGATSYDFSGKPVGTYFVNDSSGKGKAVKIQTGNIITFYDEFPMYNSSGITITIPNLVTLVNNPVQIAGVYTNTEYKYNEILFVIENLTLGYQLATSTLVINAMPINSQDYSITKFLTDTGTYKVTAYLNDDTGTNTAIVSNTVQFTLSDTTATSTMDFGIVTQEDLNFQLELENATSTDNPFTKFFQVPTLMKTKIPFAWLIQVGSSLQTAIATTSTSNIPSGSFNWKLPNQATTTIDMFSSSTIKYFFSDTYITLFRTLESAMIYFGLGWFLYHDAKKRKLF